MLFVGAFGVRGRGQFVYRSGAFNASGLGGAENVELGIEQNSRQWSGAVGAVLSVAAEGEEKRFGPGRGRGGSQLEDDAFFVVAPRVSRTVNIAGAVDRQSADWFGAFGRGVSRGESVEDGRSPATRAIR